MVARLAVKTGLAAMAALALFLFEIVRFRAVYLVRALRNGEINPRTYYLAPIVPAASRARQTDRAYNLTRAGQPTLFWVAVARHISMSLGMAALGAFLLYLVFILMTATSRP